MGLCESLTNLVKEPILFLLRWWKQARERKYQNLGDHAKKLLQQTDVICRIAKAMNIVVADEPGCWKHRPQVSLLWKSGSTSRFLNNWQSHAWVLDKHRNTRSLRKRFEYVVEGIRDAALTWRKADMKWRKSVGITEGECLIGGEPQKEPTNEDIAKSSAAQDYFKAFDAFSKEYQVIHNFLEPLIQDYTP